MKSKYTFLTLLSIAVIAVGCDKEKSTDQRMDKVQSEMKEAAQDTKDYTYAQKSEFTENMQSQLARINKELDELSAKIEKSTDVAKAEAKPRMEALHAQSAKLGKQLDEAKGATESTWNDVKAGVKKGYGELKEGFQRARQWVSEKIAT